MNYYYLKLYGLPFVTINNNKYSEILHPFVITQEPQSGSTEPCKNFRMLAEKNPDGGSNKSNLSGYIPILSPSDNASYYSSDSITETNYNYKSNPKIDEGNIPYLHAGLINHGKLDGARIDFVGPGDVQGSTIDPTKADQMIHMDEISTANAKETERTQAQFATQFEVLCKYVSNGEPLRIYALDANSQPEEYVAYYRRNSSSEDISSIIFTRSNRTQIYYAKASDNPLTTLYKMSVSARNSLYDPSASTTTYDASVDVPLSGHVVTLRQPFPIDKNDYDVIFYPWFNAKSTLYLTTNTAGNTSQVYEFDNSLLRYIPVDDSLQATYSKIDDKCFYYNNNYYFFSGSILEYNLISPAPTSANIIGKEFGIRLDTTTNTSYLKLCNAGGGSQMNEIELTRNIMAITANQQQGG